MSQLGGSSAEERRLERRRRLLTASASVFARSGFSGATVEAVCTEAGLTERCFFESFQDSEALLLALHRETSKRIIDAILEVKADLVVGAQQEVQEMLRRFFDFFFTHPTEARLFVAEAVYIGADAHAVCKEWRSTLGGILAETINPDGYCPGGMVPAAVARALSSIAIDWMEDGFARPFHEVVSAGMAMVTTLKPGGGY